LQQYLDLLKAIKDKGTYKPAARENMPGTQSLFGYQFRHNLADGFPLLTTKKISFKNIVVELLWFLRGDTNIKYLVDRGCNIWNEDAYNFYLKQIGKKDGKYDIEPMSFEQFVDRVKNPKGESRVESVNYKLGDCGYQYGKVWRKWDRQQWTGYNDGVVDQISNVINSLRNNPESRRHIVSAVDPAHDNDLALYWCHSMFQFNCRPLTLEQRISLYDTKNCESGTTVPDTDTLINIATNILDDNNIPKYYLDCHLYQRSCDVFLGASYNIASYSLLTHIIAKMCNMVPGTFIHSFGDVHIYDNHRDQVNEQLTRTPGQLPTLEFTDDLSWHSDIDEILAEIYYAGWERFIKLNDYNPQPSIKATLSTGLIK